MLPGSRSLLARAIAARGGAIAGIERESDGDVRIGMPGHWEWRLAFEVPDRMRFTLITAGEDQQWVTDGRTATTLLGGSVVSREPLAHSEALSIVRWVAVVHLDALGDEALFRTHEVPGSELPAGAAAALDVETTADPVLHYRLLFDRHLRLVEADGPLAVPAIGSGRVQASFSDFRRVDDRWLPFRIRYRLDGAPLLEERVVEQHVLSAAAPGPGGTPP